MFAITHGRRAGGCPSGCLNRTDASFVVAVKPDLRSPLQRVPSPTWTMRLRLTPVQASNRPGGGTGTPATRIANSLLSQAAATERCCLAWELRCRFCLDPIVSATLTLTPACRSRRAVAAAQHKRSLPHECRRRLATPRRSLSPTARNTSREFAAASGEEPTHASLDGASVRERAFPDVSLEGQAPGRTRPDSCRSATDCT
jgi:hypothetical protein